MSFIAMSVSSVCVLLPIKLSQAIFYVLINVFLVCDHLQHNAWSI